MIESKNDSVQKLNGWYVVGSLLCTSNNDLNEVRQPLTGVAHLNNIEVDQDGRDKGPEIAFRQDIFWRLAGRTFALRDRILDGSVQDEEVRECLCGGIKRLNINQLQPRGAEGLQYL